VSINKHIRDNIVGVFGSIYISIAGVDEQLCHGFSSRSSMTKWKSLKYILTKTALLREFYTAEKGRRLEISSLFFGSKSGVKWAKEYNEEGFDYPKHSKQKVVFQWLSEILEGEPLSVHEIGTSSGRQSAFYADKFPNSTFVGSDVFDEVVQYCGLYHKHKNLSFIKVDAGLSADISKINEDILLVAGSAAYLSENELNTLYRNVKSRYIFVGEPTSPTITNKTSVPRGGFQWHHNNRKHLESNGWKIVKYKMVEKSGGVLGKCFG